MTHTGDAASRGSGTCNLLLVTTAQDSGERCAGNPGTSFAVLASFACVGRPFVEFDGVPKGSCFFNE